MRVMAVMVLAATLTAQAAPVTAASAVVGQWFGYGQPWDKSAMYLDSMEPGGRFHAHHRFCVKGKSNDQYEEGSWSVERDILTIRIATVNGQFNPRVDDYKLLAVTAREERYIYIPMNFPYSAKRVDARFQMPACDLVS